MVVVHQVGGNNTPALVLHHGTKKMFFSPLFSISSQTTVSSFPTFFFIGLDWIGLDHPTAMRRIKEACRRYLYFRSQTMDPPMLILDPPLLGIFLCDIRICI